MNDYIIGRVWLFGNDVSIEAILPSKVLYKQEILNKNDIMQFVLEDYYKDWYKYVRKGDIIVAGENFGWGSSRPAPRILKKMGIECIVAESVSRLFFRNAISVGIPIVLCKDISKYLKNKDYIKVDIIKGIIEISKDNIVKHGIGIPKGSPPYEIIQKGGIV